MTRPISQLLRDTIDATLGGLPIDEDATAAGVARLEALVAGVAGADVAGAGTSWKPAHYVGTWETGTSYAVGDAVRAFDVDTWKLYISLVAANIGNDPVGDAVNWQDTVADARPVVVEGEAEPNEADGVAQITEYSTGGATGGTFDLGDASGIPFDAFSADIVAALDAAYFAAVVNGVSGDANNPTFIVTRHILTQQNQDDDVGAIDIDGTNLTGGGATSQQDTQTEVMGGFESPEGSLYLRDNGELFVRLDNGWWFTYEELAGYVGPSLPGRTFREAITDLEQNIECEYVSGDQEVTDTGLQLIPEMVNNLPAGWQLRFHFLIFGLCDGDTEGVKFALTAPDTLTLDTFGMKAMISIRDSAGALYWSDRITAFDEEFGGNLEAGLFVAEIEGTIDTAIGGLLQLAFAQNEVGAGAGVHVQVGSSLIVTRLAQSA